MRAVRFLIAIALVGALLGISAVPVLAACNPGRPVQDFAGFAGTQGSLSGVIGVRADIDEYKPYVSSGSESLMWVMLNSGGTRWSQIGWWQDVTTHYVFEQHTDASGHWFTNFWPGEVTALTNYKVVATTGASGPTWSFYVRGSLRSTATRVWSPSGYQLYGETHRKADQMAGGYSSLSAKAIFYLPGKQGANGTWSDVTTAAGVNNTTWYGAQRTSGSYYIWDKACAS